MDPLTHLLTGAAVADVLAPPREATGRRATLFAAVLAASPDLDLLPSLVAAFPANPFSSKGIFDGHWLRLLHRGYTHAIPVLAAAAFLAGIAAWHFSGKSRTRTAWIALAAAAFLSHLLFDMANGGVRAWLPFSAKWVGWGQFPEADMPVLILLAMCFLANHPLRFRNRFKLGTLSALERVGGWLNRKIGVRLGARTLAAACLGAVALRVAVSLATA